MRAQTATQAWVNRYNPFHAGADYAAAVALDSAGNIVVTGESVGSGSSRDYYTAKYAPNGPLLWEKRYNGPANDNDRAYSLAVDSLGNVAVTGESSSGVSGGVGTSDCYTAKYASADGTLLWENRRIGPANGYSRAYSVAVDSGGNVVVTGNIGNGSGSACFTAKYAAANGALLWEKLYNGSATYITSSGFCVAVDSAGNVAITGVSRDLNGIGDYYTAKYASSDGTLLWERRYNGPANRSDAGYSAAVDGLGNVVVTGRSQNATNYDYYTAKYAAADGALLWEKRYNGPANGSDAAYSVAADSAGNVVVTGQSADNGSDFYTAKYADDDGHLLWEARYDGPGHGADIMAFDSSPYAGKLALTPDGGAIVCGQSQNILPGFVDYTTIRYALPAGDGLQDWWEQMWWGTTAGHSSPDDFDHDGIPELLEMAFGLNPKQPDALPSPVNEGVQGQSRSPMCNTLIGRKIVSSSQIRRAMFPAMRHETNRERVERLMVELGRAAREPGRIYFTGGVSAILIGWREMTLDVDLKPDPEPTGIFEALPRLKDELEINIELAAPDDFIPALEGWRERSVFIARHGPVDFSHYDFYAQALAKIERDHDRDRRDVEQMIGRGLVRKDRLLECFREIETRLVRFPAIDPGAFALRVRAVCER